MRIILNIDSVRDAERRGRKTIRVWTCYQYASADGLNVINRGVEIYDVIKEAFASGTEGGVFIHEGERR